MEQDTSCIQKDNFIDELSNNKNGGAKKQNIIIEDLNEEECNEDRPTSRFRVES